MYELRANRLEEDLINGGLAEAFGIAAAVDAVRFEEHRNGFYSGAGGLIGDGTVIIDRYRTTAVTIDTREIDFVNYERAFSGAVTLVTGDLQLTSRSGVSTVAAMNGYTMDFRPSGRDLSGLEFCLRLDAIDRFLETADEERVGSIQPRVVEGSGAMGPDGPLLSLAGHILANHDDYRPSVNDKRGRLAEALFTDIFIQFLRDIGALDLKSRSRDVRTATIKRAEEFMRERLCDPITVADVAAAAGVNLRSLQIGFRNLLGTTPRDYLMSARLECARRLLESKSVPSVTRAAYESGIMHTGRFAQAYMKRYGELPSATLRRRHNVARTERV